MSKSLDPKHHRSPSGFFFSIHKTELKWLVINTIFYALGSGSMVAATYFLGQTIDALQVNKDVYVLLYFIVGSLIGYELFYRIGHVFEVIIMSRIRNRTKKVLFDHTTSLSFGYFADRFAGEIAHKISSTTDAFERMTFVTINSLFENVAIATISAVTLGIINPALGIFIIVWSILFVIFLFPFAKWGHKRASAYALAEAKTVGAFVDIYANISAVKVYGSKDNIQSASEKIDKETKAYKRLGVSAIFMYNYEGVSIVLFATGILIITSYLYSLSLISIGSVVFISAVALRMVSFIWEMGRALSDFIRYRGEIAQNLSDIIVSPTVLDGTHLVKIKSEKIEIKYKDVTFGYDELHKILNQFSITIKSGERIGIVGLSGAGKTTFVNLLLRFFDPQGGQISLNDRDIRDFSQEFLRSHISYISQDTSLFHDTIAKNIAYGSVTASMDEIHKAAELAYAHEFITLLPDGYESVVGERGIKLSGGQRQRIAIARAILANRPIFLLDEATSALDSDSEQKIQSGLATLMEGKTVIAVAHRLSTLSHLDRIIFIENGRIVEDGTHDELLKLNGNYAKLWHMQAGGFLPTEL